MSENKFVHYVSVYKKLCIPTCIQPLAPPCIRVPDEHVGGLVRNNGQQIAVFVPSEAATHSWQSDLVDHLGVSVIDIDALVITSARQISSTRSLPREENASSPVGRV